MPIDMTKLYDARGDTKRCKLCLQDLLDAPHAEDCPGQLLDDLTYEIRVRGENCTRGCCGDTDARVDGPTLDAALALAAVAVGAEAVAPRYAVRAVIELGAMPELLAAATRTAAQRAAAATAARVATARDADARDARARLEDARADLTPEAYARKLQELATRFGPAAP